MRGIAFDITYFYCVHSLCEYLQHTQLSINYNYNYNYNLKETELRANERIEEAFLRRLFKTSKGCPIVQLYLEAGHKPARF